MKTTPGQALALLLALALAPAAAPAQDDAHPLDDAPPTREALQKLYTEHLAEEGYRPKVDEDGDVAFKFEGGSYFIRVDEEDPQFFQLVYPNFWPIEDEDERRRAMRAALDVAARCKVAKVYPVGDNVWISVELFLEKPEGFRAHFERSLEVIRDARRMFGEAMEAAPDDRMPILRGRLGRDAA